MTKKQKNKTKARIIFTLLTIVGLVVFIAPMGMTGKLQLAFIRAFDKPLSVFRDIAIAESRRRALENMVEQDKYITLRNQLANNIQWLQQERQNVEQLMGLRNRYVWNGASLVLADVIAVFIDSTRSELIINRGKEDGLTQEQFVLGNDSIIGTISELDAYTARVRLITDPRSKIAVSIGDIDLQRVMHGNADDSAGIKFISKKFPVEKGNIVYAQKKPGFLDIPMITGIIVQCSTDPENPLIWDIKVKPACDIRKLKSITVIVMNNKQQN
ncbi:MAG: rod shape-determining protein MreC [Phycisphaerae bacterium]